jgi:hypothetical protein
VSSTTSPLSPGEGERDDAAAASRDPAAVLPTGPERDAAVAAARPAEPAAPRGSGAPRAEPAAAAAFERETVRWRWAALGLVVIAALHSLVVVAVPGREVVSLGLGLIPYLVGGALLGALTRGRSMLDAFYGAAAPALAFPFVVELLRVHATEPPDVAQTMARVRWLVVLAPGLVYVLVALLGFWIGARLGRPRPAGPAPGISKV